MSGYYEQPFSEYEERYILAEILKTSNVPPNVLLSYIRDADIEPAWFHMALPLGRSVTDCQNAFRALSMRVPPSTEQIQMKIKRPLALSDPALVQNTSERSIQPRPTAFTSINGQELSQISPMSGDGGRPRKKRGRPNKEEHDRRVAEAAERGEIYPKPRKAKTTPRPSMEGGEEAGGSGIVGGSGTVATPQAYHFAPNVTIAPNPEPSGPSTKKRRTTDSGMEHPGLPAGQVHHEEQRAVEGTIMETRPAEPDPRENLMAELHKHATEAEQANMPQKAPAARASTPRLGGSYEPAQRSPMPPQSLPSPLPPILTPDQRPQ